MILRTKLGKQQRR
ncbi:unnamed protein product [Linum tenue]|uniref:Uncharacterized protein n=1 Tax=Linum tenue TaxID=586396 RepID=A0AAV0HFL4_9ROSI|nr:unnamed protein product [Linum tenue]